MLGSTRTAIVTSTSPLFALPLSVFLLKERVNRAVWLGTACTVVGVILVS
jgi:drug/metabolite transporter (DMT)-like permease